MSCHICQKRLGNQKKVVLRYNGTADIYTYDRKHKLFPINSFVLAHSSAKKLYNKYVTLKSLLQWYHMTECDGI